MKSKKSLSSTWLRKREAKRRRKRIKRLKSQRRKRLKKRKKIWIVTGMITWMTLST